MLLLDLISCFHHPSHYFMCGDIAQKPNFDSGFFKMPEICEFKYDLKFSDSAVLFDTNWR